MGLYDFHVRIASNQKVFYFSALYFRVIFWKYGSCNAILELKLFQRKKEKEKKIRKAQEKIEKKLQRLQKNVDDMKDTSVAMKKPKSPGRPSFKSPKAKKGSIRIEPQLMKPVYKNKLQPKTKFKFPPKKPVVKKSAGKLSLTPTVNSELYI